jgi:hypothetical protein
MASTAMPNAFAVAGLSSWRNTAISKTQISKTLICKAQISKLRY